MQIVYKLKWPGVVERGENFCHLYFSRGGEQRGYHSDDDGDCRGGGEFHPLPCTAMECYYAVVRQPGWRVIRNKLQKHGSSLEGKNIYFWPVRE